MTDWIANRDLEIAGRRIRAGEITVLLLAAASRDPERFAAPDSEGEPDLRRAGAPP